MDTLHPARAGGAVAKPVTGNSRRDASVLLLVGGDGGLRSRLQARLPEFQVQHGLGGGAEGGCGDAPALILAALPLDVAGRELLAALRSSGGPPVVGFVASKDESLLRLLAPELDEVVIRADDWDVPRDLEERLLKHLGTSAPGSGSGDIHGAAARVMPVSREQVMARTIAGLEAANGELVARASCLERVVQATTELKSATTREALAERVLRVLADVPGFSLVAVGLQDEDLGATQMSGVARLAGGFSVPLGRRTVLLDILNLATDRKRVSNSQVVKGLCVSIHGSPDTWGPRTAEGEWDLAEVFDGSTVALTPVRASGRSHGFLLVKAGAHAQEIDADSLRVVEILANLSAVAFDNLRLQEAERRRTALIGMVSRLGRALIDVHDLETVLLLASEALRSVLEGALVSTEPVDEAPGAWVVGGLLAGPKILKAAPDSVIAPSCLAPVGAQLIIPVRVGDRIRAVMTATSASTMAFDDLDLSAVELFAKVVAKAHANADAFQTEQKSFRRLRLVADIGRIAGSSLDMDEVLARSLAHLCQHGSYERGMVGLVDPQRGKLVLRAQASSTGARLVDGLSTRLSEGISGTVAATGQAMLIPDVSREPTYIEVDPSVRSELCVPLRSLGTVIGVLDVESHDPAAFDEGDLAALTSIADHLAAALHNARLFRQVSDKNRELRESEKNKTEFLSIVAHDLRTPLTSIRSAAELVLMYRDEPPEVTGEFLESIRDEAARLGRLVDDFLAHSRMEAGILDYAVEEVSLSALLEHFCRVFERPLSQKHIVLETSVTSDLPVVLADSERLSQVVANLLSNATKYTPEGGRIRVSAFPLPAGPEQVLGRVRIDVSDTGPGIQERDHERVFEKFVRLDGATGGGAGLGLPIARAIVEHLGGRLWLDSEPGRGSTFSFVLPARLR